MKLFSTLVVAAVAVNSFAAADRDCGFFESSKAFIALAGLLSGPNLSPCATDSGYDMINAKGLPTDEQYVKMCALDTCKGLIKEVIGKNPPNCLLKIPTSGAKLNVYQLANSFDDVCEHVNKTPAPVTPAPTTAAPVTKAPTTPVTKTPVTSAPSTATPTTSAPTTTPATKAPTTTVPATETPATTAPVTKAPTTQAPIAPSVTTKAPVTGSPAATPTPTKAACL